jgi:hypothetical protein
MSSRILAWWSSPGAPPWRPGPALAARAVAHAPEELGEEVAEVASFHAVGPVRELEARVPVRRRREALPGLMALADGVVGGAPFGVGQNGIGFVDLAHARRGVGFLADVGVVLARQLAVGLADFLGAGVAGDTQHLVVVLELHDFGPPWMASGGAVAACKWAPPTPGRAVPVVPNGPGAPAGPAVRR